MKRARTRESKLRLGAHLSISGGLYRALERGDELGCDVVQLFTHSNQQWAMRPLTERQLEQWQATRATARVEPVMVHGSYLINLASPGEPTLGRSRSALAAEYERCELLAIPYLVLHPGAHLGTGIPAGLHRVAQALTRLFEQQPDNPTVVLLENTAGQGTGLGHRLEHLRDIFSQIAAPQRLGVCFDTCHAFAAGYDLRTSTGWRRSWAAVEQTVGLENVRAFHLNDSKKPRASHLDRHEHLGRGTLGLGPFRRLVNDPRFVGRPMVLETPKPSELADQVNLAILRSLEGQRRIGPRVTALARQEL